VFNVYSSRVFLHAFKIEHTLYITSLCILFFCQFFYTLRLSIYQSKRHYTLLPEIWQSYKATSCHVPQASNLQNQSRGNREIRTVPAGSLASESVRVVNWPTWHEVIYTRVDLWFYIFVISKVNGVLVISYTFRHIYPSRIILRNSLNRKLCGPLKQWERVREKYLLLTGNWTKISQLPVR